MSGKYVKISELGDHMDCAPGVDAFALRDDEFNLGHVMSLMVSGDPESDFGYEVWFNPAVFSGGDIDLGGLSAVEFMGFRCMFGENLYLEYNSNNQYMLTGDTSGVIDINGEGVLISRSRFGGGPLNLIDQNGNGYQVILRDKNFYIMNI